MNFVFYDTETTGLHKAFDQILQFAAILTDENLVEIDRFEIRCRLLPHIIASPGALKVTGVSVSQLTDANIPSHYQMMCQIREKLTAWSPAIFIGYNTIDFDENMLRQAFYQTLHPLYLTNTNGNCRADTLDLLRAVDLFDEGKIVVPKNGNKKVFKLDKLAPANGFQHDNAHDALADVEATIYMCQLIKERSPLAWEMAMRCCQKVHVERYIQAEEIFWIAEHYMGRPYLCATTYLGQNPERQTEHFLFNLEVEPTELATLNDAGLINRLGQSPKVIRKCISNAFPNLMPFDSREAATDRATLAARAAYIKADEALRERLISAHLSTREPYPEPEHLEEKIYSAFIPSADEKILTEFHKADWEQRPALLEKLTDTRSKAFGYRLLYTEAPHLLSPAILQGLHREYAQKLLGPYDNKKWLTIPAALEELEAKLADCTDSQRTLLTEYSEHLKNRAAELAPWIEPDAQRDIA